MTASTESPKKSPILAGLLSALLPGLGQGYSGHVYRGVSIFLAALITVAVVGWYGVPGWYLAPVGIWLWNVWDASSLASGRPRSVLIPLLFGLVAAYGIGWQVVNIDLSLASMDRAVKIIQPLLRPDFIEPKFNKNVAWVPIEVPCSSSPPPARNQMGDFSGFAIPDCAGVGETVVLSVTGLWPDMDTEIYWFDPIGAVRMLGEREAAMLVLRTDENGALATTINVPRAALFAAPDPTLPFRHRIFFEQSQPIGGFQISENGNFVLQGMSETIALALMATTLSIFIAIPLSFLAARNLMAGNPVTFAIYVIMRTFLNILRSIESLIIAIVFVVILGLGPFPGVLALALHSVAALAKLYSEVIEGIDPGPIEAVRATGANWVQVVRYGVIPQIVPPFTAFTIYRWDINVRSSTIIGFVGGGGIGFFLIQWIQINDLRAVSAAFIAIAVVVVTLDYISAKVRERLV